MNSDFIKSIEIDTSGRLCITPVEEKYSEIWRTATGVHWDTSKGCLYTSHDERLSYAQWFLHIVNVLKTEIDCDLFITDDTEWINISPSVKAEILA